MPSDHRPECVWPSLAEPYATALREAVAFVFSEFEPAAIVATGTIVRGEAHANSDLDVYVVHLAPFRRRVQRFFAGVPTEIFVNPPRAVRRYFADEDNAGRRLTAHMLATGFIVFQSGTTIDELRSEAQRWLAKQTDMPDYERMTMRYAIATRLEDALDVVASDAVTASLLLAAAVNGMLEYVCKSETGRIPRSKQLLATVLRLDAEVGALAAAFARASNVNDAVDAACAIADRTIRTRGFFEWDSGPGPVP